MGQEIQCDPRVLSTMLGFSDIHQHSWEPDDLRAMLRHQLAAPLCLSLGTMSGEVAHELRKALPEQPLLTLGQLLQQEEPPLELLILVKRFAKLCRSDKESVLPPEILMLMYYLSIAVALMRLGQPISQLATDSLRRGLNWLSEQAWIPDEVRSLLSGGLAHLQSISYDPEANSVE